MAGGNLAQVDESNKNPPKIEVKSYGGTVLNESTSFLICDVSNIYQYDPGNSVHSGIAASGPGEVKSKFIAVRCNVAFSSIVAHMYVC
jgi:hypothetical protein